MLKINSKYFSNAMCLLKSTKLSTIFYSTSRKKGGPSDTIVTADWKDNLLASTSTSGGEKLKTEGNNEGELKLEERLPKIVTKVGGITRAFALSKSRDQIVSPNVMELFKINSPIISPSSRRVPSLSTAAFEIDEGGTPFGGEGGLERSEESSISTVNTDVEGVDGSLNMCREYQSKNIGEALERLNRKESPKRVTYRLGSERVRFTKFNETDNTKMTLDTYLPKLTNSNGVCGGGNKLIENTTSILSKDNNIIKSLSLHDKQENKDNVKKFESRLIESYSDK